jgi:hypothetical protein
MHIDAKVVAKHAAGFADTSRIVNRIANGQGMQNGAPVTN